MGEKNLDSNPFVTEICQATILEILKIGTSNLEIAIFLLFPIPAKLSRDFSEDAKIGKCRSRPFPIFQNSGEITSIWEMCHLWFVAFSHNLSILWVVNSIGFEFYSKFSRRRTCQLGSTHPPFGCDFFVCGQHRQHGRGLVMDFEHVYTSVRRTRLAGAFGEFLVCIVSMVIDWSWISSCIMD